MIPRHCRKITERDSIHFWPERSLLGENNNITRRSLGRFRRFLDRLFSISLVLDYVIN